MYRELTMCQKNISSAFYGLSHLVLITTLYYPHSRKLLYQEVRNRSVAQLSDDGLGSGGAGLAIITLPGVSRMSLSSVFLETLLPRFSLHWSLLLSLWNETGYVPIRSYQRSPRRESKV